MLLKQTKIVATISDQRCDVDFIKQLFDAGMNVVRMNTAHLGREGAEKLINNVRTVSNRIAILMDTKGPEVRTTVLAEPIPFKVGDRVKVVGNPEQETTRECISVSYSHFVKDLDVDGHILIDDGDLELIVVEKTPDYLLCEVQNEATLGSRKSVNVPGVRINLPSLTEKDRTNILYAIEKNIDFIAHSFVRNKQDILDIKSILDAHNSDIRIVAKIENQEGVDNGGSWRPRYRSPSGTHSRHPTCTYPQVYSCQEAGDCCHADAPYHDFQPTPHPCGSDGHCQCHLLSYGCLDAER